MQATEAEKAGPKVPRLPAGMAEKGRMARQRAEGMAEKVGRRTQRTLAAFSAQSVTYPAALTIRRSTNATSWAMRTFCQPARRTTIAATRSVMASQMTLKFTRASKNPLAVPSERA